MDAEGPPLPHQAIQQQGRFLSDLVVLDEKLLELVDDQQDARQEFGPFRSATRRGLRSLTLPGSLQRCDNWADR